MLAGYVAILPQDKETPPPPDPRKLKEAAQSALAEIVTLKGRALTALDEAEKLGNSPAAVLWFREVRSTLELLVKTRLAEAKQIQEDRQVGDVLRDAAWLEIEAAIVRALQPFPEARSKVVGALATLKAKER